LIVRINDGARQTLEDAAENLSAAVAETRGQRRPLLIDIRAAHPLDPEVRRHYSGLMLIAHFSAIALLVEASPYGQMMGTVYVEMARPGVSTQLFFDEAQAIGWLNNYR
jgi:hypothetical protein